MGSFRKEVDVSNPISFERCLMTQPLDRYWQRKRTRYQEIHLRMGTVVLVGTWFNDQFILCIGACDGKGTDEGRKVGSRTVGQESRVGVGLQAADRSVSRARVRKSVAQRRSADRKQRRRHYLLVLLRPVRACVRACVTCLPVCQPNHLLLAPNPKTVGSLPSATPKHSQQFRLLCLSLLLTVFQALDPLQQLF